MKFPFNQEETVLYNTQNRSLLVLSNSLFDGNIKVVLKPTQNIQVMACGGCGGSHAG